MTSSATLAPGIHWPARFKAAGLHLGLSLLVAAAAAALVFGVWYPTPFREISGGRELFTLIVAVDVVLGPLLTFAVFNRRKPWPELRRDLAVVVMLQLGALGYGLHTVWVARPVYLVFEVDRFVAVRAVDIESVDLARAPPEMQRLPMFGPRLISAVVPRDPEERLRSLDMALAGVDINLRPETWQPYAATIDSALSRAKPLAALRDAQVSRSAEIDAAARLAGRSVDSLVYLPIVARELGWVALLARPGAEVVGYLPFGGF